MSKPITEVIEVKGILVLYSSKLITKLSHNKINIALRQQHW
jgi:hypothetical protein